MSYIKIQHLIENSLNCFWEKDTFLLKYNANERSITHKLAEYIQFYLQECRELNEKFQVDCEYNRLGYYEKDPKTVEYSKRLLELKKKIGKVDPDDEEGMTVYPDIIIHKRGEKNKEDNLLVIEVKKTNNMVGMEIDKEKLRLFTSGNDFEYQYGLHITFFVGEDEYKKHPDLILFQGGEIVSNTISSNQWGMT